MPDDLVWPMTLENATERQILIALYTKTERLEVAVTELSQAVEQLKSSVSDLADTVNSQIEPLQESLAAAQQALDDFTVADLAEDADFQAEIDRLKADVQTKVDEAKSAADNIQGAVAQIQTVRDQIEDEAAGAGGGETGPEEPGGGEVPTGPDAGATGPEEPAPTGPDSGATGPDAGATGPTGSEPYPDQTLPGDLPPDEAPANP